jgi:hypothetical protein
MDWAEGTYIVTRNEVSPHFISSSEGYLGSTFLLLTPITTSRASLIRIFPVTNN